MSFLLLMVISLSFMDETSCLCTDPPGGESTSGKKLELQCAMSCLKNRECSSYLWKSKDGMENCIQLTKYEDDFMTEDLHTSKLTKYYGLLNFVFKDGFTLKSCLVDSQIGVDKGKSLFISPQEIDAEVKAASMGFHLNIVAPNARTTRFFKYALTLELFLQPSTNIYRITDPISDPTLNKAQYACIDAGGTVAIEDSLEISEGLTSLLSDSGMERIVALRKFHNIEEGRDNVVWQHGRKDADPLTACPTRYGSFDFKGSSEMHLNANHDAYINGVSSASSLIVACQFLGENLAEGKNTSSSGQFNAGHGPDKVTLLSFLQLAYTSF